MIETAMSDAVLARLEALAARLDEQSTEIARLKADNDLLKAEIARRSAAPPTVAAVAHTPPSVTTSRRGMLARVLGGTVAATIGVLAASRERPAHADFRGSPAGGSTTQYGLIASPPMGFDPELNLSAPLTTFHGVIGALPSAQTAPTSSSGVLGISFGFDGVLGVSNERFGVLGQSTRSAGVRGSSFAPSGQNYGVWGYSTNGFGIRGTTDFGGGVLGESTSSVGVQGVSTNNAGVYGTGPIGVFATGTGTAAVYGASNGTYGVWGNSGSSAGLIGTSTTYIGVQALSTSHWGLHARSPTYAGVFEGNVFVTGQVIALGGVSGLAAATASGTGTRALVEDVGEATLVNGKATVALDKSFAEEVKRGQYQVFMTPHDASVRGLAVVARRPDGFDVQELADSPTETSGGPRRASNAGFSYRVVARRAAPSATDQAPPDLTTIRPAPKPPEPPK